MKHLTYADKSVLVGDEAADVIILFSALLAENGHADAITLNAIGADGDAVVASFVLGSGTNLMVQTTTSSLPEPDNANGVEYMKDKIELMKAPPHIRPAADDWSPGQDFEDHL